MVMGSNHNAVNGQVTQRGSHVTLTTDVPTARDYNYTTGKYISLTLTIPVSGRCLEPSLRRGTHRKVR